MRQTHRGPPQTRLLTARSAPRAAAATPPAAPPAQSETPHWRLVIRAGRMAPRCNSLPPYTRAETRAPPRNPTPHARSSSHAWACHDLHADVKLWIPEYANAVVLQE